jgi:DNA-binding transcriptional MerR regulator/methylmalonyl-CoA mutase cobalamin-binding subunit
MFLRCKTLTIPGQQGRFIGMTQQVQVNTQRHPMRIVVLRTGLTPDLLRAWERRYAVVAPIRSESGQRLYSDADVERLTLLMRAVNGGRAISQVAKLSMHELHSIVEQDKNSIRATPEPDTDLSSEVRESILAATLVAVETLDAEKLESTLRGAVLQLGMDEILDGVVAPLLINIGSRWHQGILRPAHEHLATAVVRRTLAWMMESGALAATAPTVVVATLPGQTHELGAMLAAAAASSHGWRVLYLGANLPVDDIALAADHACASAVALSFVYPTDDPAIPSALRELRSSLPAGTTIIAGGGAAANYATALTAVGAFRFASIGELRSWLQKPTIAARSS